MDNDNDIFSKIDAIRERRDAEVLSEKNITCDDFPTLTEVIDADVEGVWKGQDRRISGHGKEGRRMGERRVKQRRLLPVMETQIEADAVQTALFHAFESRLTELFVQQQLHIEDSLRKVIREELGSVSDRQD